MRANIPSPSRRRGEAAFTMIEIALSIAVVAFAMVAILGVLPTGLQVQKDNREETIINADGAYILEAIRSGFDRAGLLGDAAYFLQINNKNGSSNVISAPNNAPLSTLKEWDPQWMVGLLSTRKDPRTDPTVGRSNVVVWMRALSSPAIDRDPDARDVAFRYQMIVEIERSIVYPPALTDFLGPAERFRVQHIQQQGLHEVRLTMRWPLYNDISQDPAKARVGTHRRTFRLQVPGMHLPLGEVDILGSKYGIFAFQPSQYRTNI